jgi:hypothetical protein
MPSIDRRPSGKYRARYREVPGGPQRSKTFTRKADARAWLTEVEHQLLTGTYTPREAGQITLAALCRRIRLPAALAVPDRRAEGS